MGFVGTMTGHLLLEAGVRWEVVEPVVTTDWPGRFRRSLSVPFPAGDRGMTVVSFGFGATETREDGSVAGWLQHFESLLGRILVATKDPRAIRRATVIVDAAQRLHTYRWVLGPGDSLHPQKAPSLRLERDSELAPDFVSRYSASTADRVQHFVQCVTETRVLFGLRGDGWARTRDDQGRECLPFWADAERASRAARGEWADHAPKAIALDEFVGDWLTGMVEDGIVTAISPEPGDSGEPLTAAELLVRLQGVARN